MFHFQCPQCEKRLKAHTDQTGQWIRCPYCQAKFVVGESPDADEQVATGGEIKPDSGTTLPESVPTHVHPGPAHPNPGPTRADPGPTHAVVGSAETGDIRDEPLSRPGMKINQEELIDMTAMVDIVFFLLIFFLVTSMSAILSSTPLPRPEAHNDEGAAKSARTEEPQNDSNAIVIKINKDDAVEIDGVPFREMADVTIRLRQLRDTGGADTSVLVIGHPDASHGTAAGLDAGYEAGINHLRLAVPDDEPE